MKTIKYLFWLIILVLLGILIYQNLDYFMAATALNYDLKVSTWQWTIPELPNIAYFGICFLLGFILAGFKGIVGKYRSNKEIKAKDITITTLNAEITTLKTELEVFQHDPYIKNDDKEDLADKAADKKAPENLENNDKEGNKPEIID